LEIVWLSDLLPYLWKIPAYESFWMLGELEVEDAVLRVGRKILSLEKFKGLIDLGGDPY
jgi:hypothetical protein